MYAEVASMILTPDSPAVVRNSVALAMAPQVDSDMLDRFKAEEKQWFQDSENLRIFIAKELSQSKELLKSLSNLFISIGNEYRRGSELQNQIIDFSQILDILNPSYLDSRRRKFLFFSSTPSKEEYYANFQNEQELIQKFLANFAQLATKRALSNVDLQASKARLWSLLIRLHAIYLTCAGNQSHEIKEEIEVSKNIVLDLLSHSLDTYLHLDYLIRVNQVQIQIIKLLSENTFEFLFLAKQLAKLTKRPIALEKVIPLDSNTALASLKPCKEKIEFSDLSNSYCSIQEIIRRQEEFHDSACHGINELAQRWKERHGNI